MTYRISPQANADLEAICNYVAQDNPGAADSLDERIHKAIRLLAQFPGMGHARPDVQDTRYLFWTVGNFIIAYRIQDKELLVVRVIHGARDFRKLFTGKNKPKKL